MLTKVVLENYKSFGRRQDIPLEPLTVIVGPNNSGKSVFMGLPNFLADVAIVGFLEATERHGGLLRLLHSPHESDGCFALGWSVDNQEYFSSVTLSKSVRVETLNGRPVTHDNQPLTAFYVSAVSQPGTGPLPAPLIEAWATQTFAPVVSALRSPVIPEDWRSLNSSGFGWASVLQRWRSGHPDRADAVDAFVRSCFPAVEHVLLEPEWDAAAKEARHKREHIWFQVKERSGLRLSTPQLSDGVLWTIALGMLAAAPESAPLFIEEPETAIHPTLLPKIAELLKAVVERGRQVIITTHSPRLLNEFKDNPEAILLFRQGGWGTEVQRMTAFPKLVDNLHRQEPGEMLEQGFFTTAFEHLK